MSELKPCPFCGGTAHIDKNTTLSDFVVYCEGCDSYFLLDDFFASEEDVIKAYNRRAKMINNGMFTSKTDEWETPQDFFDEWNQQFHFTLDACANEKNHKCDKYYTKEDNGLTKDWGGEIVWCNPPYGKGVSEWVKKCHIESQKKGTIIVALLPARTDTKWFHEYVYYEALTYFVKGRLKFGNSKNSAPFPSMVCIWF